MLTAQLKHALKYVKSDAAVSNYCNKKVEKTRLRNDVIQILPQHLSLHNFSTLWVEIFPDKLQPSKSSWHPPVLYGPYLDDESDLINSS